MSIFRGFKFFSVSLIILLSSVSLISSVVYGDDWVYSCSNEYLTQYYNSSSIIIDKEIKLIKVWAKFVYTERGKNEYTKRFKESGKKQYIDFDHTKLLVLFNYKDWRCKTIHIIDYSKSGNILFDHKYPSQWKTIISDNVFETFFNKIIQDYKIKR